ncbi:FAD-containing oxidoreductase [Dyella solisilvae]|uniref:FAD-containing oxidoreductase n=1 Tax=Dyella solisilvae TaxID=1920168 RepID=A0A370K8L2_9GAMM|nr:FAD-containing oxidoreductase [Dyella solisilvae]RDI98767.1 FAD-containing oxidoreductase [Dyella solisilvae]
MAGKFDAIVIGTGQAGPSMAGRLTDAGMTVAVVERHLIGGTCVNTGCKPTKTLVASAYAAHHARRSADYGVITGPIGIDMARVHARSQKISVDSRNGNETWLRSMKGCTLIRGHARFESAKTVRVGDELLEAERIFINVGGRALVPDMPGVGEVPFFTNSSLLDTDLLPDHLVVVGGSYIGLEFAQIYARFGSRVTVVEKGPRLIGREDAEISDAVRSILEAEGIQIRTGAECIRFARHPDGVAVGLDCSEGVPETIGSHLLLAVGRRPNTDDLGLEMAGIETDKRGYIQVNDRLETNVPGIWALGDCNGRGAFTHTAYNDFEIVAQNLLDGANRKVTDRIACYALYVDPPLGRVGMTETEARATGSRILVGRRPMRRVGRAVEKDEQLGFMKIVVDADTDAILGAAILGTSGDEAIHTVLDIMAAGGNAATLRHTMHIHPTVSELVPTIAGELRPVS